MSEEKKKKINIFSFLPDILMIIGFVSLGYGLNMIYPPAMWIICGILVILVGYPKKGVK